jgi:hypothetical protein
MQENSAGFCKRNNFIVQLFIVLSLDHVFILVSPSAPEADALLDIGLLEGSSNEHPGQGTSNRRFFMANTTLELLFINNIAEAVNGAGKKLQLVERAIDAEASPFGLVTRSTQPDVLPAFSHWRYQPDYFPAPMRFLVGKNSNNFAEPLCICMPPELPMPSKAPRPSNTEWYLTRVDISIPGSKSSPVLNAFSCDGFVQVQHNKDHHMHLVFNDAKTASKHFFPEMQLSIEY